MRQTVGLCNHKELTCRPVLKLIIQHLAFTVLYSGQSSYRVILDKLIVAQLNQNSRSLFRSLHFVTVCSAVRQLTAS